MFVVFGVKVGTEHVFGRFPNLEEAKDEGEKVGSPHREFPGLWGTRGRAIGIGPKWRGRAGMRRRMPSQRS